MIREYGYEYDAILDKELIEKTKSKVTYDKFWDAICLRSGRDALKTIAREYKSTNVYLPALSCDSMSLPFEMYGHNLYYYQYDENYHIDLVYLKSILKDQGLFLYMDYFGKCSITDNELCQIKENYPNLVFIEDRTHTLLADKYHSFSPDYVIASIRKWINCPDGGLLWTQKKISNTDFGEDLSFSMTRLKAQTMRNLYFKNGDESIKTEYRKIFSSVSDIMDNDINPCRMSAYSYEILKRTDFENIRNIRKRNAQALIDILKNDVTLIQKDCELSDLYVAFMIQNRESRQSVLSSKGIFNTIIWPLTDVQRNICSVAKCTEKYMLAAPCDQRYTIEDMKYIGTEILKVIRNSI